MCYFSQFLWANLEMRWKKMVRFIAAREGCLIQGLDQSAIISNTKESPRGRSPQCTWAKERYRIFREREGKKSRKELTTDYEFEHHRPWFVGYRLPCNIDLCLLWFSVSICFSLISRFYSKIFSSLYKRIFFVFPLSNSRYI